MLKGLYVVNIEKHIRCIFRDVQSEHYHDGNSQFTTAGDLIPKFMLSPLSLGRVVLCTFSGLFNRGYEIDMPIDKISI